MLAGLDSPHPRLILLTGGTGGRIVAEGLADHVLIVPSATTARIQEMHIFIIHCICERVEDWLLEG